MLNFCVFQGYVEMTGIDSETSQDIAEAISLKGGRYLEAQIQGSKTQVIHVSYIGDVENM